MPYRKCMVFSVEVGIGVKQVKAAASMSIMI